MPLGVAARDDAVVQACVAPDAREMHMDLAGELAGRHQDQGARSAVGARRADQALHDRQQKGGGLARARCGRNQEIQTLHRGGYHLRLDLGRGLETLFLESAHERVRK